MLSLCIRRAAPLATTISVVALLMSASGAAASRTLYGSIGDGHVQVMPIGADGGIFKQSAPATGSAPRGLALTPDGSRLFVANSGGTTISAYTVDKSGALSARPSVSAPAPSALAVTPGGEMLFTANPSGSISGFIIDQFGNLSSPIGSGASIADTGPDGIAVSPDGARLYVAYGTTDQIATFAIGAGASLEPLGVVSTGTAPSGIGVTPDGSTVYVANTGDDSISAFSVAQDGTLTAIQGSPYLSGDGPVGIAVSPDQTKLLATNATDGTVSRYLVNSDGSLTSAGPAQSGLAGATGVTISPNAKFAFVSGDSNVWAFALGADGALTQIGQAAAATSQSTGLVVSPNLTPAAKFEPVAAAAGTPTELVGSTAQDPDGSIASWHWDFGDGGTSDESNPTHVFAQPGPHTVTLTVVDNEGCSTTRIYTGQTISCAGGNAASQSHVVQVPPPPDTTPIPPPCQHNGNDGFCGTPDLTAPTTTLLGINDGANITTLDAPDTLVGSIANDPSGIKSVMLRFTKAAGFLKKKKTVRKRVCRKVKGHKKKRCTRRKVTKMVATKTPLCLAPQGTKNTLIKYVCSKVKWISIGGDTQFRWSIPVGLSIGSYTVDVVATDGAGNVDTLEPGRNHVTFKVVKTPSNADTGTGTPTPTPTTTTTTPIDDTGSPFGKG